MKLWNLSCLVLLLTVPACAGEIPDAAQLDPVIPEVASSNDQLAFADDAKPA